MSHRAEAARDANVWDRFRGGWTSLFAGLVIVPTVVTLVRGDVSGSEKAAALALSVAFLLWFWFLARPSIRCRDDWRAHLFVVGAIVLWTGLVLVTDAYFFLLIALYPLIFSMVRVRHALLYVALLTGADVAVQVHFGATAVGVVSAIAGCALGALFALWITAIIDQSVRRQELIEELEAAQAELAVAEREAGMRDERDRLAAEIHDTLAQGFTSILMLLQSMDDDLPPDAVDARRRLDLAVQTARDNLAEARRLVAALTPAPLAGDEGTLEQALGRVTAAFEAETGVEARVEITGSARPVDPASEVAILRVAQESLANVRKHARASTVTLTLTYDDTAVVLDVTDDGVGFDPSRAVSGFGLRGMRRRLASVGGRMAVDSAPGRGTTVTVALP